MSKKYRRTRVFMVAGCLAIAAAFTAEAVVCEENRTNSIFLAVAWLFHANSARHRKYGQYSVPRFFVAVEAIFTAFLFVGLVLSTSIFDILQCLTMTLYFIGEMIYDIHSLDCNSKKPKVVDALFVAELDGHAARVEDHCRVNMETGRVFDTWAARLGGIPYHLNEQRVVIDGIEYDVVEEDGELFAKIETTDFA